MTEQAYLGGGAVSEESAEPTRKDFCKDCGQYCAPGYLNDDGLCQHCANINEPCYFMPEPRGALGLAGGWCEIHNEGWNWCEHTKGKAHD